MGADKAREESDLVRVLELTEEVVRLKLALGDTIREGTFAFSRQRYARGPHAVSESHYDLNTMRATTKMRAESRSIDGPSGVSAPRSTSYTFNVVLGYDKGPLDIRLAGTYRDRYLDEIDRALKGLIDNPQMGSDCSDLLQGARKLITGRHLVFYEVDPDRIFVIRVLHQSMDVPRHLRPF